MTNNFPEHISKPQKNWRPGERQNGLILRADEEADHHNHHGDRRED